MATEKTDLSVVFRAFLKGTVGTDAGLGTSGNDIADEQTFDAKETITFGTANGEANQWWYDRRILAASQTDSHDLVSGLTTPTGHTIVGAVLKGVFVHNRSDETLTTAADGVVHTANAAVLELVVPANGALFLKTALDAIHLSAGAWVAWYSPLGVALVAGTGDLINIVETAALEAAYDIAFLFEE